MATRSTRRGCPDRRCPQPSPPAVRSPPHRRRRLMALALIVMSALAIAGYQFLSPHAAPSSPAVLDLPRGAGADCSIVLFTLDTLRADHVGCYGYRGVKTPALDALASGGVRFADAVAVAPMTLPSHASIMTGDYPPHHGVRDNGTYRLLPERETLAERLQAEGYATAAFIGAFVLDKRYGLDQGFDVYDDRITASPRSPAIESLAPERPGDVVTDAAIRWVEAHLRTNPAQRFFTWVHLFDPHAPYSPPPPFDRQYASSPYDGEVAFADQQVGRFVDKLRELGLLDKTILVVVGDHGEGLGEHGEGTHGLLIYESTVRVPLIFYGPGVIPSGRVVGDRVAATVDIKPTVLELLGFEPGHCDGLSLLGDAAGADRAVYLETLAPKLNHGWSPLFGLRRHHDKYIEAPTPEYYALSTDPGERRNLWAEHGSTADLLEERLAGLLESFAGADAAGQAEVDLDQDAIDKLAALGYVRGSTVPEENALLDPKEVMALWDRKLAQAAALVSAQRAEEAIPVIKELLEVMPGDASVWLLLSGAQAEASLLDEALTSRMKAIELQPNDAGGWILLAELQYAKGDVEAWRVSLAEAERIEPEHGGVCLARAIHAMHTGQYQQALAYCEEARVRDPTRYTGRSRLLQGRIHQLMGRADEAGLGP